MGYRKSLIILLFLLIPLASAQATPIFEVDWSTALGDSTLALTDGGMVGEIGYEGINNPALTAAEIVTDMNS